MNTITPFAILLRETRLTQAEAAKLFGVSLDTVHAWEAGRRRPSRLALSRARAVLERQMADVKPGHWLDQPPETWFRPQQSAK